MTQRMGSVDPRLGSVLQGRYRIVERLASGGMGVVYRGQRVELERAVAIKFLHAAFATDVLPMKRFEREARIMGRLAHPNCVSVIDIGFDDTPYIVMDYISGWTLKKLLEDGPLEPERAIHIVRQVLSALAHAHRLDIVHRDVKPANVIISDADGTQDHVYVLDFGLAKFREGAGKDDVTGSVALIGTPSYMSPEQARGEKAGIGSDVYSAGLLLFELIAGHNPFRSDSALETLMNHQNAPIPRLAKLLPEALLPAGLDDVLARALAKDVAERYGSALEFAQALDALAIRPSVNKGSKSARWGSNDRLPVTLPTVATARPVDGRADTELPSMAKANAVGAGEAGETRAVREGTALGTSVLADPPASRWSMVALLAALATASALVTWLVLRDGQDAPAASAASAENAAAGDAGILHAAPGTPAPADAAAPDSAPGASASAAATPRTASSDAGPGAAPPVQVSSVREVVVLIQEGRRDEAIAGILQLMPTHEKSAYLPFLLGNLYFEKEQWSAGLIAYGQALRNNASTYARKREINQNAIRALASDDTRAQASELIIKRIGKAALPYLLEAATMHASPVVREHAAALAARLNRAR